MMFNLGFSGGSYGGSSTFTGYEHVNTYADLPNASSSNEEYYIVDAASGIWFLNRKEAGFYKSNGSIWSYIGSAVDTTAIKVNNTTIIASPIELAGSNNIILTPDIENNKITIDTNGMISKTPSIKTVTYAESPYTVPLTDDIIEVNASGGNISIILPDTGAIGAIYKVDSSTNIVTITVLNGTISGLSSFILQTKGDSYSGRGASGKWGA